MLDRVTVRQPKSVEEMADLRRRCGNGGDAAWLVGPRHVGTIDEINAVVLATWPGAHGGGSVCTWLWWLRPIDLSRPVAEAWTGRRTDGRWWYRVLTPPCKRNPSALDRVTVRVGRASEFPSRRDHAYCHLLDAEHAEIVVAPKLLRAAFPRQAGVMAHEYGHAALLLAGKTHTERDADTAGEALFGVRISYDRIDVQTTGAGTRPRPSRLPR